MSVISAKKWTEKYTREWIKEQLHKTGGKCPGPCGRRFVYDSGAPTILAKFVTAGTKEQMTIDHVVPRAKGGTHANSNLRIMCRRCNMRKSDTVPVESNLWHGWT